MFFTHSWRWGVSLLLAVSLLAVSPCHARTLKVRADHWYPLNGDPQSDRPGFAIEILRRIFTPRDIALDYDLADWSRSLEMVHAGEIDCVVGAYRGEAPGLRFPETPLAWDIAAFYVRADSDWHYQGLESLKSVILGVIAGYGYGDELDRHIADHRGDPGLKFMHGKDPLWRNIKKLIRGRLDVLVESPFVMESLLRRMELSEQVREAGRVGRRTPLYLACSPESGEIDAILSTFDRGMQALRESGELGRILETYRLPRSVIDGSPDAGD